MAKEIKIQAGILAAAAVLYIAAVILSGQVMLGNEARFFLFLAVYLVAAFESLRAIRTGLMNRKLEKEHLLMVIAHRGSPGGGALRGGGGGDAALPDRLYPGGGIRGQDEADHREVYRYTPCVCHKERGGPARCRWSRPSSKWGTSS